MTLGQACPADYCRAQCAFKDSMSAVNLEFGAAGGDGSGTAR
ncbi:uncharacterized protein DNG_05145 [Cephalotrichum gorgonifer]|uniref:Uncharacterized protein n=1 Tax=Cephalotrichum gorgonifer TaxID=2041049 RepID=A0AAE8N0C4_9PEZI|nr:uncharacterized protein DNG_05145 [Cephalotrichum gorgonifer]